MKAFLFSLTVLILNISQRILSVNLYKLVRQRDQAIKMCTSSSSSSNSGKGFQTNSIPKPNIIVPSQGSQNPSLEKFLMMYTCKICSGRNAHMVSKVAYNAGMVVASCRHCKNKHLIADNQRKLDFPSKFGEKIEDYLRSQGEVVQKLSITTGDLEKNYLVDTDGVITLVPKEAGQPSPDSNIVDVPFPPFTK